MGGAVFATDGIYTPRIPSITYDRALRRVEEQLNALFDAVEHALPAPEKEDHGDLDVLALANPACRPDIDTIARAVGAVKYLVADFTNGMYHFAVPWPEQVGDKPQSAKQNATTPPPPPPPPAGADDGGLPERLTTTDQQVRPRYIQVDLTLCASRNELHWRLFAYSHGDAMNILGSIVRRQGFTLTNQALYLRLGLGTSNKKLNRIKVSSDPDEILSFLKMDKDRFWAPFETKSALMMYISTCRFFDAKQSLGVTEEERRELDKRALDKSRMEFRPLFRYWYKEWLPRHKDDRPSVDACIGKQEAAEDAFTFFGNDVRKDFEAKHKELSTVLARDKFWTTTRAMLANERLSISDLHDTLRAIRREVIPAATATLKDDHLSALHRAYLTQDFDMIGNWISANHALILARWKAEIEERRSKPLQIDEKKACKYSTTACETYSAEDDALILEMKAKDFSWSDILSALSKKSKSQLQAHWKKELHRQ